MTASRYLQLILLSCLVFLSSNSASCQTSITVTPFPSGTAFLQKIEYTVLILQALRYENRNEGQEANSKWEKIREHSLKKDEHLFINQLLIDQQLPNHAYPKTKNTVLAVSGYLSWDRRIPGALKALQIQNKTNEILLEEIRLNLMLGNYQEVKDTLVRFSAKSKEEGLVHQILKYWYLMLTGDIENAGHILQSIETEYLYAPQLNFHSDSFNVNTQDKINLYQKAITRFPSNKIIFEYLIKNLAKAGKYCELKHLLKLQANTYHLNIDSQYLNNAVKQCLNQNSGEIKEDYTYLNWQATQALNKAQYSHLKEYAEALIRYYPEFLDGQLFMVEYYQKTGQIRKKQELLKIIKFANSDQLN